MAAKFGVKYADGFLITASTTIAYTVPTSIDRSIISAGRVTNYGTTPEDFTIYMIPSGGSVVDQFIAIDTKPIAAGETILLAEIIGETISEGATIQALASTVTKLSLTVEGTDFTT